MKIFRILLALCLFVGARNSMASQSQMTTERGSRLAEAALRVLGEIVNTPEELRTKSYFPLAKKAMESIAYLQQQPGFKLTPEQNSLVVRMAGILIKEAEKSTVSTAVTKTATGTTGRVLGGRRTTSTATTGTAAAKKVAADDEIKAFINSHFNTNIADLTTGTEEEISQKIEARFKELKKMQPASNLSNDYLRSLIQEALNMNDQVSSDTKATVWTQINKLFSEDIEKSKVKPTVKPSVGTPTSRTTGRVLGGGRTTTLPRPVVTETRREAMPTTTPAVRTTTPAVGTTMTGKTGTTGRVLGGRRVGATAKTTTAATSVPMSTVSAEVQEAVNFWFAEGNLLEFFSGSNLNTTVVKRAFDHIESRRLQSNLSESQTHQMIARAMLNNTESRLTREQQMIILSAMDSLFKGEGLPVVSTTLTGPGINPIWGTPMPATAPGVHPIWGTPLEGPIEPIEAEKNPLWGGKSWGSHQLQPLSSDIELGELGFVAPTEEEWSQLRGEKLGRSLLTPQERRPLPEETLMPGGLFETVRPGTPSEPYQSVEMQLQKAPSQEEEVIVGADQYIKSVIDDFQNTSVDANEFIANDLYGLVQGLKQVLPNSSYDSRAAIAKMGSLAIKNNRNWRDADRSKVMTQFTNYLSQP